MRNSFQSPDNEPGSTCGSGTAKSTGQFEIVVEQVSGLCRAGEQWSQSAINDGKIPVLSCEGPCIKGEIARRAANLVPLLDGRFKRACHGEAFFVPHSAMSDWVRQADSVMMIDGCFLSCHGRVLENMVPRERIVSVNAHAIHKQHADDFSSEEVPDARITELAGQVARKAIDMLGTVRTEL